MRRNEDWGRVPRQCSPEIYLMDSSVYLRILGFMRYDIYRLLGNRSNQWYFSGEDSSQHRLYFGESWDVRCNDNRGEFPGHAVQLTRNLSLRHRDHMSLTVVKQYLSISWKMFRICCVAYKNSVSLHGIEINRRQAVRLHIVGRCSAQTV